MASKEQPVVFTTQTQYPLPAQKFLIPATWKRYQLSQLVNKALALDTPVPFDFLVQGEILRTTLAEWCSEHGIGEEETLQIEYVESVLPPQKMSDFPHEEWVSAVSCNIPGHLLTASYDGQMRLFDYSQNLITSAAIHSEAITSLCVSSPASSSSMAIDRAETTFTIATSSHDTTARITKLSVPGTGSATTIVQQPTTLASLHLHTAPLSSIATSSDGKGLLTSSWDGIIAYWDTSIPSSDEVPDSALATSNQRSKVKKRKLDTNENGATATIRRKAPLRTFKSHTARVSKVIFVPQSSPGKVEEEALSCGFDSTVRLWDIEMGICKHTITASEKPFLSLALSPTSTPSAPLALATSTDRTMTLYDLRTSSSSPGVASFLHPATPSCLSAPPPSSSTSPAASSESRNHQVITGAYDGIVRLWDLRSKKSPLAAFKAFEDKKKVLDVDWAARGDGVSSSSSVVGIAGEGGTPAPLTHDEAQSDSVGGHIQSLIPLSTIAVDALYNAAQRYPPPRCHPGTRDAVLGIIDAWMRSRAPEPIFWLHGTAGVGKSAIVQTICESSMGEEGPLRAAFFFGRGQGQRALSRYLVPTIAHQLSQNDSDFHTRLEKALRKNPDIYSKALPAQMRTLIVEPLNSGNWFRNLMGKFGVGRPTVIAVDGLDECDGEHNQEAIIEALTEAVRTSKRPLHFLVASRPEHHILKAFNLGATSQKTKRVPLGDVFKPADAIRLFLTDQFRVIVESNADTLSHADLPASWPGEEVIAILVVAACGQFIYAHLVIAFVKMPHTDPIKQLEIVLDAARNHVAFSPLDSLYLHILRNVAPRLQSVLRPILTCLVVLAAPQMVSVIADIVSVDETEVRLVFEQLRAVLHADLRTGALFGHPITFAHASFRDFLVDPKRSADYAVDVSSAHNIILSQLSRKASVQPYIDDHLSYHLPFLSLSSVPERCGSDLPTFHSDLIALFIRGGLPTQAALDHVYLHILHNVHFRMQGVLVKILHFLAVAAILPTVDVIADIISIPETDVWFVVEHIYPIIHPKFKPGPYPASEIHSSLTSFQRFLGSRERSDEYVVDLVQGHVDVLAQLSVPSNQPHLTPLLQTNAIPADAISPHAFADLPSPSSHSGGLDRCIMGVINQWLEDKASKPILWLSCPVASNMSSFLRTVCNSSTQDGRAVSGSFFFRVGQDTNSQSLIPTLAYQLANTNPCYRFRLHAALEKNPGILTRDMATQMRALLVEPINANHAGYWMNRPDDRHPWVVMPTVFIIDGLDKYRAEEEQAAIIEALAGGTSASAQPLRFLISSPTDVGGVGRALRHESARGLVKRLSIDDTVTPNDMIRHYLMEEFRLIADADRRNTTPPSPRQASRPLSTPWPGDAILSRLVEAADNRFDYARLASSFIKRPGSNPQCQLDDMPGIAMPPGKAHRDANIIWPFLTCLLTLNKRVRLGAIADFLRTSTSSLLPILDELWPVLHVDTRLRNPPFYSITITDPNFPKFALDRLRADSESAGDFLRQTTAIDIWFRMINTSPLTQHVAVVDPTPKQLYSVPANISHHLSHLDLISTY